jgi:aminoglycoside phosphotransferase (APT) family kinase protein
MRKQSREFRDCGRARHACSLRYKVDVAVESPLRELGSNVELVSLSSSSLKVVLRRKPSGRLISSTAHRIEREYLILARLTAYNASLAQLPQSPGKPEPVPVPKVYGYCSDPSVVGAEFYVMDYVQGRIFEDVRLKVIPEQEERRKMYVLRPPRHS